VERNALLLRASSGPWPAVLALMRGRDEELRPCEGGLLIAPGWIAGWFDSGTAAPKRETTAPGVPGREPKPIPNPLGLDMLLDSVAAGLLLPLPDAFGEGARTALPGRL